MASTPVINLRKGHAVRHNNEICLVVDHELKTPPRMASYVQMSIRSVATKKIFNLRLTSNDSLEGVVLERTPTNTLTRTAAATTSSIPIPTRMPWSMKTSSKA